MQVVMKTIFSSSRAHGWKVAGGSTKQKQRLFVTTVKRVRVRLSATIVRSVSASSVARIYTVVGKENFTSFTKLKNDGIVKLRQT